MLYALVALSINEKTPDKVAEERFRQADELLARLPGTKDMVKAYFKAKDEYAFALGFLQGNVRDVSEKFAALPAGAADDIHHRAEALGTAQAILQDYADQIRHSPLIYFEPGEMAWFDFTTLAEGFGHLSGELYDFARLVGSRKKEYKDEYDRIDAEEKTLNRTIFDALKY